MRVLEAGRFCPGVVSPDFICALQPARRDLDALGSDRALVMVWISELAISEMLGGCVRAWI